jgi:hypothetical protein
VEEWGAAACAGKDSFRVFVFLGFSFAWLPFSEKLAPPPLFSL